VRHPRLSQTTLSTAVAWLREGPGLSIFGTLEIWPGLGASERRTIVRDLCTVGAGLVAAVAGVLTAAPWWTWLPAMFATALKLDDVNDKVLALRSRRRGKAASD